LDRRQIGRIEVYRDLIPYGRQSSTRQTGGRAKSKTPWLQTPRLMNSPTGSMSLVDIFMTPHTATQKEPDNPNLLRIFPPSSHKRFQKLDGILRHAVCKGYSHYSLALPKPYRPLPRSPRGSACCLVSGWRISIGCCCCGMDCC
jgi:hypothetical protein